jgi:hypothetical protein
MRSVGEWKGKWAVAFYKVDFRTSFIAVRWRVRWCVGFWSDKRERWVDCKIKRHFI